MRSRTSTGLDPTLPFVLQEWSPLSVLSLKEISKRMVAARNPVDRNLSDLSGCGVANARLRNPTLA